MNTRYTFSLIRYVHDVVTGEFVNVGVVLYVPEIPYADALCSTSHTNLKRVACLFPDADMKGLRQVMKFVQKEVREFNTNSIRRLALNRPVNNADELLRSILPFDDSAIQFIHAGGGMTSNPAETLQALFTRYVCHLWESPRSRGRDDRMVWGAFRLWLERRSILNHLSTHCIKAPGISHEFSHAWKNGQWHCLEPVSFDLADPRRIEDKAIQWLGRATALDKGNEEFTLYYLLGTPSDPECRSAFENAITLLKETPVAHRLVVEDEAEQFAQEVRDKIVHHGE